MENKPNKITYRLRGLFKHQEENEIFQDIDQRLTLLEENVFKKVKRLKATEPQRFLIAFHLGLIKPIQQINLLQKEKYLLLSVMLDIDPTNAKKFFAQLGLSEKPLLHTISNYTFLVKFFGDLNLTQQKEEAEKILLQIEREKEEAEIRRKARKNKQ